MAKLLVLSLCVALGSAAPSYPAAGYGLAAAPAAVAFAPAQVREQIYAGPAIAETRVRHGVVGTKTVQVGSQTVQVGHQYVQAGQTVQQPQAYSHVETPARNTQYTVPIAAPLPAPAPANPIPPPPVNLGPAPADAVTQERVLAPVRTHTRITPQVTRIEPELQVNKYAVEVPRAVPVPVERTVVHTQHVPRPYNVEVPRPVAVPQPFKVHPVHKVVDTPIIHKKTYSVEQPIVHHHTHVASAPVVAYNQVAAAAPVAYGQLSAAYGQLPAAYGQFPAAAAPVAYGQLPAAYSQLSAAAAPVAYGQLPAAAPALAHY